MSFYRLNTSLLPSSSSDSRRYSSASVNIRRYSVKTSSSGLERKFKSEYVGFSSDEVEDKKSFSIVNGNLNITNGKVTPGYGGSILRSMSGDPLQEEGGSGGESGSLEVEIISNKSQSIYEGHFGFLSYNGGYGGSFGDSSIINFSGAKISAMADSVTGIVEINDSLTKYDHLKIDIKGSAFKSTGAAPHVILEDTFEGVNSGLPSFLSQVQQLNILRNGLSIKKRNPYDFDNVFIPYQSNYSLSCDTGWYDVFNSTVDFSLHKQNNPLDITLSFPSTVFEIEKDTRIWVGGPDGVVQINGSDYSVSVPDELMEYNLSNVISIKQLGTEVVVLSQEKLIIIRDGESELDPMYGVSGRVTDVSRIYNGMYAISTDDGIYSKMSGSSVYSKKYENRVSENDDLDKFFLFIEVSGFIFAISENGLHLSSNGVQWGELQGNLPNSESNKIVQFRSGNILLSNFGVFYDNGSMLEESFNFQLLFVLGESSNSVDNSVMRANDATSVVEMAEDGSVLKSELIIVFSDGTYSLSTRTLDSFTNYEEGTFSVIHKIIRFQNKWLIFSFDNFKFIDDINVYRMSTGLRI